jgi:hypothetical protein
VRFIVTFYPPKGRAFSTSFTTRELAETYAKTTKKRWPKWAYRIEEE